MRKESYKEGKQMLEKGGQNWLEAGWRLEGKRQGS